MYIEQRARILTVGHPKETSLETFKRKSLIALTAIIAAGGVAFAGWALYKLVPFMWHEFSDPRVSDKKYAAIFMSTLTLISGAGMSTWPGMGALFVSASLIEAQNKKIQERLDGQGSELLELNDN